MNITTTVCAAALLTAGGIMAGQQQPRIDIVELPGAAAAPDAVAPWVASNAKTPFSGKPLFTIPGKSGAFSAQAWAAVSADRFHFRVVVNDKHHFNAPDSVQLWAADGIEICLDMRGDKSGTLPRETPGVMGPDDAKFILALSAGGIVGRCMQADRDENTGLLAAEWVRGAHDSKQGITTYELDVPWSRFETTPGLFPSFGLAVQINDLDLAGAERVIYNWGEGTFGNMRPGLFKTVAVGLSPEPLSASVVNRTVVWNAAEYAEVVVALTGSGTYRIETQLGEQLASKEIRANGALQRFAVRLYPGAVSARSLPFTVRLLDPAGAAIQERSGSATLADNVYRALMTRIDEVLDTAAHPLFRRHLLSVKAIVTDEWARCVLYREYGERGDARKTFEYISGVLEGFEADAGTWETYLSGKRDLYMSYISRVDRTVQFYALSLPKNWDPSKKYPLFVELHGAGNENFLSDLAVRLGVGSTSLDLNGYATHRTSVQKQGAGYWIMPSGRGNTGYRGPGEDDVWEAYDDMHKQFTIDENRRYLFGFSMGGGGTWSLGTRTPDRWAALMIMAGGLWSESRQAGIGRNISYVPTYIWCGEKDELTYENVAIFKEEIEKYGGKPVVKTVPGLGHNYTIDVQDECAAWLVSHVRTRPDSFSYVADTERHLGVWGVTMARDISVSGAPSFACAVRGNAVSITSEGAPGLTVALGKDGLGLEGAVTLDWNGTRVYDGPVKTVTVGVVPQRRRR